MSTNAHQLSAQAVSCSTFGYTKEGKQVELFTLKNENGVIAKVITYGATLSELHVPDKDGKFANIVLGFDSLEPYETVSPYMGCTIGRCANRIAKGRFTLNGKEYILNTNNGPNSLHGGKIGFDKQVWSARICHDATEPAVEFTLTSPDGDEGYPGNVHATIRYTLTNDDKLELHYTATTDQPSPINLTNHSFFNLSGAGNGTILDHVLTVKADSYTPSNAQLIPTGEVVAVKNSAMDFTKPKTIGQDMAQVEGGYDLNYVLNRLTKDPQGLHETAILSHPSNGRSMVMLTTEPGVQFYTGNFLDGTIKGIGGVYVKHAGLCLEAQHFPDSVNQPNFPSVIVDKGQIYKQHTVYAFSAK